MLVRGRDGASLQALEAKRPLNATVYSTKSATRSTSSRIPPAPRRWCDN